MNISIIDHYDEQQWEEFLLETKGSSFYHRYPWIAITSELLKAKPYLIVLKQKDKIKSHLPLFFKQGSIGGKRLFSMPFGDFAGPLGGKEEREILLKEALSLSTKLKANLEISTDHTVSTPDIYSESIVAHYVLPATEKYSDLETKFFHKKTRNMVKKAQKCGVNVEIIRPSDICHFYTLYLQTMRKLKALPIPEPLFLMAAKHFSKESKLFVATGNNKTIGYLWTFIWNSTLWIWANATDEKYLTLGTNYALYSAAIKTAAEDKTLDRIDFGSSEINSSQEFFKLRWGTKKLPIYEISNYPQTGLKRSNVQSLYQNITGKLPLPLYQLAGTLAYKLY